ncbi:MAG: hypothetical protein U0871_08210 [Gemmataceae bacterium]
MTLDAVRAAILSDQPWARLDELVRAELTAGRLTHQIGDELQGMLDELQETPGLSENGDDALMETLESLFQMGPRKYWYENPPVLPNETEVSRLPRWAQVAFAARCARRALPILRRAAPQLPDSHHSRIIRRIDEVDRAGSLADASLVTTVVMPNTSGATDDQPLYYAQHVFASVDKTALLVATSGLKWAKEAIWDAACAISMVLPLSAAVVRQDYDHIARLAKWRHWTDETPVPSEVFGPLWPEGPPPGWPADQELPQRTELSLDLLALEQVTTTVLADEAAFLFSALNRYYIARTGDRLTLEGDVHTLLSALVPAGV